MLFSRSSAPSPYDWTTLTRQIYRAFLHLGAGLSVGMTGLAAGYCIGIVGDKGVRAYMEQSRVFVGMVLILIFGEVLGLYGYVLHTFSWDYYLLTFYQVSLWPSFSTQRHKVKQTRRIGKSPPSIRIYDHRFLKQTALRWSPS